MKLIVAVDKNWNIGNQGDLLFHISDDLKFFRRNTEGKVVVMGRKTLESFPGSKPLKNRVNIVLTRNGSYSVEGAETVTDVDALNEMLKKYPTEDVYVIGGEEIYRLLLPCCDTAIITHVDAEAPQADKKFPKLGSEWQLVSDSGEKECGGYKFHWCEYKLK